MNTHIKSIAVLLFLTATISNRAQAQDSGELRIPLSKPGERGELEVDINSGSITVVGGSGNEVIVSYRAREKKVKEKEKTGSSDGLNRISGSALDLEASEDNNRVEIDSDSWKSGVDLEIQVPKNFDLELGGYNNGDILVKNINGEVVVDHYNGKITLENISGSAVADTYNGSISVTFDAVSANTPMAFTTYNGKVDLSFPADTKASFKLKSRNGDILEGFDMQIDAKKASVATSDDSGTYKVKVDNWVRGSINGGGPEITCQNTNGNIYIRKR